MGCWAARYKLEREAARSGHDENGVQAADGGKRLYEQYGEVKKDLKVYCVIKQNTAKVTNTGRACAEDV